MFLSVWPIFSWKRSDTLLIMFISYILLFQKNCGLFITSYIENIENHNFRGISTVVDLRLYRKKKKFSGMYQKNYFTSYYLDFSFLENAVLNFLKDVQILE